MIQNVWWALALPALGFLICSLLGRPGRKEPWAGYVATAAVAGAAIVALVILTEVTRLPATQQAVVVPLWTWVTAGALNLQFALLVDPLSALMLFIVTSIGALIHWYAIGYMHGDRGFGRFFACMNLFILAMSLLVLANNFMLLIVGWGGVGLASYLLIAFWFEKDENARAGVKAFVVNSVGDIGLIAAAISIFTVFGALDYETVFRAAATQLPVNSQMAVFITLALLLAAIAKSGQLPLHVWLPDAMAGPTPVSALIHAATMVTAGVYLIARAHPLFERAPSVMAVVAIIGAVTAIFAATLGLVQPNIKRVLAYSTVSQLGYMFMSLGLGGYVAAVFHLATHAIFKAALFLAAGGVIHALHGEENLFKMGGLARRLPLVYGAYLLGGLALAGVPPFAGFFSKDEILQTAFGLHGNIILGLIALLTVFLTGFYVFRSFFLAFHGPERIEQPEVDVSHLRRERRRQQARTRTQAVHERHLHNLGQTLLIPTITLGALSLVGSIIAFGFGDYLEPVFTRFAADPATAIARHERDLLYWTILGLSSLLALAGIGLAYLFYVRQPDLPAQWTARFGGIHTLLMNRYYIDRLYDRAIVGPARGLGEFVGRVFDPQVVDGIVMGISRATGATAGGLRVMQTGFLRNYALTILIGVILVLLFVLFLGGA